MLRCNILKIECAVVVYDNVTVFIYIREGYTFISGRSVDLSLAHIAVTFYLDEIKHILDIIIARYCYGIAVLFDLFNAYSYDIIFIRLYVKVFTLFERSDAFVSIVKYENVVVKVGRDKSILIL